jgi:hypothetical protein
MAWQIATAFAIAGGLGSSSAKRKAARAAMREARAQAAEIRRQKFDVALLASEQHQDLMEQFSELSSYNQAVAAYAGRTGRSLQALRKSEERKYGQSVTRLRQQEQREKESLEREAKATEQRGVQARKDYRAQARSTLFDTAYRTSTLIPRGE